MTSRDEAESLLNPRGPRENGWRIVISQHTAGVQITPKETHMQFHTITPVAAATAAWERVEGVDAETGEAFAFEHRGVPTADGAIVFQQRAAL